MNEEQNKEELLKEKQKKEKEKREKLRKQRELEEFKRRYFAHYSDIKISYKEDW